ncbi:MAG TPA: VWA domain-containing protein [Candidatus Krumholzibacteria bacterium]|jgi:Ca-activated chloride channel family protein
MSFAQPWFFAGLPVACLIGWLLQRRRSLSTIQGSSAELFRGIRPSWRVRSRWLPRLLFFASLVLIFFAMAGPRLANSTEIVRGEGIDIALALDISGSMRALDFEPEDRLAVAKRVIRDFIAEREHDRVALVVFAAKAFTQCPLTLDHDVVERFLDEIRVGLIDDGTAIGLGIATGAKRLARSEAKSKVLVLLTDGMNNVQTVDPETAAEAAHSLGIRIYSIGVGKEGLAPMPVDHPVLGRRYTRVETHIDEELLTRISKQTGGQYFRAQSAEGLQQIFEQIDELERTEMETTIYTNYEQLGGFFLFPAFLLLLMHSILASTIYRVLPS